jgi:hypothetical protein
MKTILKAVFWHASKKSTSMRILILMRIGEISKSENGFSKSLMRWKNFEIRNEHIHISKFDFNTCDDIELLENNNNTY